MKDDPVSIWKNPAWVEGWSKTQYSVGIAGWIFKESHRFVEKPLRGRTDLRRVIEVGGGAGVHVKHVLHPYDQYVFTDGTPEMLDLARKALSDPRLRFEVTPAETLPYDDVTFDRLIACHVLEHLYKPHEILREWNRVVRPGGVISLVVPCEPGFATWLGQRLGAPRRFAKRLGYDPDYLFAREHVNSVQNLLALVRFYFEEKKEIWWPFRIPGPMNFMVAINITR